MTQADSVHSTPPTNTSAPRDVQAFRDLESAVCDLDRLSELTMLTACAHAGHPTDERSLNHTVLLSEILLEKIREFKAAYYAAWE